jgi:hypothetical protein
MTIDASRPDLPPIRTQADLTAVWTILMGELGFASRSLWVLFVLPGGDARPAVMKIGELEEWPDDLFTGGLVEVCRNFVDEDPANGQVAMLLSRPGAGALSPSDRAWASALYRAARLGGLACHPLHLANDVELRLVAIDDVDDLGATA